MDLFHLSDLQRMFGIKQETKDAIEQIYDDIRSEEEWLAIVSMMRMEIDGIARIVNMKMNTIKNEKPGISLYTQANMLGFSPFRERLIGIITQVLEDRSTNTSFFQDVRFFVR